MDFSTLQLTLTDKSTSIAQDLLSGIVAFAVMVLILAVGWVVAWVLCRALRWFLVQVKLETHVKDKGLHDALLGFNLTHIAEVLLKLAIMITFLGVAADVVQNAFLMLVAGWALAYFPMLVQGIVILVVALLAGDYVTDRIKAAKHIPFANAVGIVIEVFIAWNALVIALPLILPSASPMLLERSFELVLSGLVIMFGLGGAIALGWGLKDTVNDLAKKKKAKFEELI